MLKCREKIKTFPDWLLSNNERHNSPIVRIFINPLRKPVVLISDYRESMVEHSIDSRRSNELLTNEQDILTRRTKEFDKPDFVSELFYSIAPQHHTVLPTNDQFRAQRKLLQDLMAPPFLNEVAAPQLYSSFMDLVKLWSEKMRLSKGHPFTLKGDIHGSAIDALWAAVFGIEGTATVTRNQINSVTSIRQIDLPECIDDEVEFLTVPAPASFDTILKLPNTLESIFKSPYPTAMGFLMRTFHPTPVAYSQSRTNALMMRSQKQKRG